MPSYAFLVEYEIEREQGKFASREEIEGACIEALEEASPELEALGADGASVYQVVGTSVSVSS